MLDCLTDYIGYRPVCGTATVPESGLWADDAPGLDRNALERLADNVHDDHAAVWSKVYGRACDLFASDVRKSFRHIRPRAEVGSAWTGEYQNDFEAYATSGSYAGVLFDVCASALTDLVVNSCRLYLSAGANATFYLFDAQTGQQLETKTETLATGHNHIQLNWRVPLLDDRREFFVCYDDDAGESFRTKNGSGARGPASWRKGRVSKASSVIESNINFAGVAGENGLVVDYNVRCNLDNFVCIHRDALAIALWQKVQIEFWREIEMNYSRLNLTTLISKDEIRGAILPALTNEYLAELAGQLETFMPYQDRFCFECKDPVQTKIVLP